MECKIIKGNALHIQWLFSPEKIQELIDKIPWVNFHPKNDPWRYSCHVEHFSPEEFWVDTELRILGRFLSKLHKKQYNLGQWMELIWMKKWDVLYTHTDKQHSLQGVLYLTNTAELEWGNFILEGESFFPNVSEVVIFPWSMEHSVPEITSENNRYSLSFWFIESWLVNS
jgi:hypothetical protein